MRSNRRACWLLVPALSLVACSSATNEDEVVEITQPITMGDPVEGKALPTVGMLIAHAPVSIDGAEVEDKALGLCTGTLISPTAVLTAEHCVNVDMLEQSLGEAKDEMGNPRNIMLQGEIGFRFTFSRTLAEVKAGTASINEVVSVDEHNDFAPATNPFAAFRPPPARWNDIAIVHLAEPYKKHAYQRIATPAQVKKLLTDDNTTYRVAGYGLTDDSDMMSAGTLTNGRSHLDKVGDFELLAGNMDPQQACRGDSGGPIFADMTDNYQIGIASRVNVLAGFGRPSGQQGEYPPCETGLVYTRVDAYTDWIAERVPDLPIQDAPDAPEADAGVADAGTSEGALDGKSSDKGCSVTATASADRATWQLALLGLGLTFAWRRHRSKLHLSA